MKLPLYPKYKDSGVKWLGQVPEHWDVDRLKWSTASCKNGIWGDEAQQDENDIPCIRVADFDRARLVVTLNDPTIRNVHEKDRVRRLLQNGDLLLEKSGGGEQQPVGCVVLYTDTQPAVCSNFIARVEISPRMNASYWRYVHAAAYSIRLTTRSINQTSGIQNLDQGRYFDERVVFPPYDEQVDIAAFLEKETRKIDALIEEQQRLIDLLKEKRQAIISHAVTKGLNPDAPMKPSGIDWIGNIPAHWDMVPLGFLAHFISGGTPDKGQPIYWDGAIPWVSSKDMKTERILDSEDHISEEAVNQSGLKTISAGHILIVVRGMILAHTFPVALACGDLTINQDLKALKCAARMKPEFLLFAFQGLSAYILANAGESAHGTKKLETDFLRHLPVLVPPTEEQAAIVEHLHRQCKVLESLTQAATRTIDILLERRSALISAAITGQIDVRNYRPQEASAVCQ